MRRDVGEMSLTRSRGDEAMQTEGGSASTMGAKENAGAPGGATVGGEGLISAWDGWAAEDAWRVMRERHSVRS